MGELFGTALIWEYRLLRVSVGMFVRNVGIGRKKGKEKSRPTMERDVVVAC